MVDREIDSQIEITVHIDTTSITHTHILVFVCVWLGVCAQSPSHA